MARCSFAAWRGPVPGERVGAGIAHRGLVLHVEQGTEAGTDSWFHNPAAQVSAHFGVGVDGELDQWVDTDDEAWAESAGNPYWVSVEIAGQSGGAATGAQVATLGRLYAWGVMTYGWPLTATDDPAGAGLGWHGMGGAAWGGHLDCPGDPIKAQRAAILAEASSWLDSGGGDMSAFATVADARRTRIREWYGELLGVGPGGRDPESEQVIQGWLTLWEAKGGEAVFVALYDSQEAKDRRARQLAAMANEQAGR